MGSRVPKRKPVRNPGKMVNPRVLAPIDQIAPHYGGRDATRQAIAEAEELGRQLTAISDFGGNEYRRMFPEIDYSNYEDDLLINPVPVEMVEGPGSDIPIGEPDGGVLMMPDETLQDFGQIKMRTGGLIDAPDEALDMPSISFAQDLPEKNTLIFERPGDSELGPDLRDEVDRRGREGNRMGSVARSVEMPMTDYVTMTPDERLAGIDLRSTMMGSEIDQTLAQIRRAAGAQSLEPDDARKLIDDAIGRSKWTDHQNRQHFWDESDLDSETGLTMDRLVMLAKLPPEIRAFLPKRIRELLTLGGVTSGLLSGGGSSDTRGIDPRSTTGPLSGLTDF